MELFTSETLLRKSFFKPELLVEGVPSSVPADNVLLGKIVGIFFSASWCPPCLSFVSRLVSFYEALRERNLPFEVVFVSCDHTEQAMQTYFLDLQGDWLALPFHMESTKQQLLNQCGIVCIPKLIVTTDDGSILTTQGRKEVAENRQTKVKLFQQWQAMAKAEQAAAEERRLFQQRLAAQEQDVDNESPSSPTKKKAAFKALDDSL